MPPKLRWKTYCKTLRPDRGPHHQEAIMSDMDVGLWFATVPPVIVPVSKRAKKILRLPEGFEGMIVLEEPASIIAKFPDEWMIGEINEQNTPTPPHKILVGGLEEVNLH